MQKKVSDFVFAVLVLSILTTSPAHAYLDGATVSLVLQGIAGAFASALIFGKMYWNKLVGVFKRQNSDTAD